MTSLKELKKVFKYVIEEGASVAVAEMPLFNVNKKNGNIIFVKDINELQQVSTIISQYTDIKKCNYDHDRLDAYYKNGKRAFTIFTQKWLNNR